MSRVSIYFEDSKFESSERYLIFDSLDFLAGCGGVSGLFMGFSILSFIEIFYYVILWVITCRKRSKQVAVEPVKIFILSEGMKVIRNKQFDNTGRGLELS